MAKGGTGELKCTGTGGCSGADEGRGTGKKQGLGLGIQGQVRFSRQNQTHTAPTPSLILGKR